jgi:hypothetical protein
MSRRQECSVFFLRIAKIVGVLQNNLCNSEKDGQLARGQVAPPGSSDKVLHGSYI